MRMDEGLIVKACFLAVQLVACLLYAPRWRGGARAEKDTNVDAQFEADVAQNLSERRMELMSRCMVFSMLYLMCTFVAQLYMGFTQDLGALAAPEHDVLQVAAGIIPAIVMAWPASLTTRSTRWLALVEYLIIIAGDTWPALGPCRVVPNYIWMAALRLPLNLFVFELPLSIIMNVMHFVAVGIGTLGDSRPECELVDGSDAQAGKIVPDLFLVLILSVILSVILSARTDSEARAHVKSRISESRLSAGGILLNLVCDAVVELDEDQRVASSTERLDHMLRGGASLLGLDFKQFVFTEDEKERFVEMMQCDTSAKDPQTKVFHVQLRGCRHNKIDVQIFQVFSVCEGRGFHLLGIRESSELECHAEGAGDVADDGCLVNPVEGEIQAPQELRTVVQSPHSQLFTYKISVTFQAFTFAVVDSTPGFRALLGNPPENITSWLPVRKNHLFKLGYGDSLNAFLGQNKDESCVTGVPLTLKVPRSAIGPARTYVSECALNFVRHKADRHRPRVAEGDVVVTTEFLDIDIDKIHSTSRSTKDNQSGGNTSGFSCLAKLQGQKAVSSTKLTI